MICSQNEIKTYKDFHLTNFNTLKIDSIADFFYLPETYGEMISVLKKYKKEKEALGQQSDKYCRKISPIVIGNGSNILFSSKGVKNPLIYSGNIKSITCFDTTVEVEAGYKTQALSKYALSKKLSGFEFLIGIPASLGGAIYQNAGAHNQTISDYLTSAKVYDCEKNKILTLKKEELDFSYRHSILQEKPYILLSAKFNLIKKDESEIKSKMDENLIFRKNRQPNLSNPNAGSVFKNPQNCEFSAGALIDKCGFRGYKLGDCKVWDNHCNFIVNEKNATSLDYSRLIFEIYTKVKEKFNIELKPEIIYIGEMTKEEAEIWKILKN